MAGFWESCLLRFEQELPAQQFNTWICPLRLEGESAPADGLRLVAPNTFILKWVRDRYLTRIEEYARTFFASPVSISLVIGSGKPPAGKSADSAMSTAANQAPGKTATAPVSPDRTTARAGSYEKTRLFPSFTFDNLVVGKANDLARAAAVQVAHTPGGAYNPLFIYGGAGLGKTHLLQAIGHHLAALRRGTKVAYVRSETFTNEFINAIQTNSLVKFRRRYRQADILLIDDIQFLAGKERSQEEFFHTFNSLFEGRKQIVLSSDQPPSEISQLEQRLVSRFEWGLTAELQPPDMETRLAILRKKAAGLEVSLPAHVLEYLAHRIKSNVRRLEGALLRVASFSSLSGRPLTDESIEHVLRDILQEEARRAVSIDQVQRKVAEHYDVRLADMTSKRRPANIAFPRQIAMFISRRLTKNSLQDIGEAFGGRDHGTVIHACKTVQDRMDKQENLRQVVRFLETALQR
jgi:chromosomal replication initiator protein